MSPGQPAAARANADFHEFGAFRIEPATRSLYRAGQYVALTPKLFETLLLLAEEAGRVVAKEQLMERVWPGVVVEEGSIANNISARPSSSTRRTRTRPWSSCRLRRRWNWACPFRSRSA